jgi:hypothetical protein
LRESIDQEIRVSGEQILWLAMHPLREGTAWDREGLMQSVDTGEFPAEIRAKLIAAKLELPLRYLEYRRLIKLVRNRDATMNIAVTFAGADRAIRLHSARGRLDLWFRENRDGVFGLIIPMLISFLTSLCTFLILTSFR